MKKNLKKKKWIQKFKIQNEEKKYTNEDVGFNFYRNGTYFSINMSAIVIPPITALLLSEEYFIQNTKWKQGMCNYDTYEGRRKKKKNIGI